MPSPTLVDTLRAFTDDEFTALLSARPDLMTPPPADVARLATRAGAPGSVARACEQLDTLALATIEALLLLDADTNPVAPGAVADLLGTEPALRRLRALALVWGEKLSVVPAARDALGPFIAGLGRPLPALDDADLPKLVDELSEGERQVVSALAAGPPIGATRDAAVDVPLEDAATPVQRLLARGLLVRRDHQTVELPRQLGVQLRGGTVFGGLTEPALPTSRHGIATVDQVAAGEGVELSRQVEALLESWTVSPPPVLKAGGLGVREIRRVMRALDVDHGRAVLLAELTVGTGLVVDDREPDPHWQPTTLADSWLASLPAQRWAALAATWLALPRLPALAAEPVAGADKPPAPLSDLLSRPTAVAARRRVLDALAALPEGEGITSHDDLVALLAWRAPRRGGRLRDQLARWTLAEANGIGMMAMGALPSAARALLADEPADESRRTAATAMAAALPAPVDHVLVQADHTVVAPGRLEHELAGELAAMADVESAGHATVYRITEESLRRAMDGGRSASELHEVLARSSRTPVPQSLTYMIDDVARRFGRLRAGASGSFLRSDDDALLAEVLTHQGTARFGLRRIAPTVIVSPLLLSELLDGLRDCGFDAAAEGPDGRIIDLRRRRSRVPARVRRPRRETAATAEQVAAIVSRIRAGDRAATARHSQGVRNPGGTADASPTIDLLATAARDGLEVWIDFVDSRGAAAQRVIRPVSVAGGILRGGDDESYPLHRITAAAIVDSRG